MGKFSESMEKAHIGFIKKQKMFFVATAPLSEAGHINLSPKGGDHFRVLDTGSVAYMDLVGSGNETSAHLLENGRICIMFCAFEGPPNILRLYGTGRTVLPGDREWKELSALFSIQAGTRQIIMVDVKKVQTSCGFSVPLLEYLCERDHAEKWVKSKGEQGLEQYMEEKNTTSLDGLPTAIGQKRQFN